MQGTHLLQENAGPPTRRGVRLGPLLGAGSLLALSLLVAIGAYAQPTGALTQATQPIGCVSETGNTGQCTDGKGLDAAFAAAESPDGRNLYVASRFSDAVAVFRRDATTGRLTQLGGTAGCVSETGSGGACADGRALLEPRSVAVSEDGANLYVASFESDAVAVFRRDATTGRISQLADEAGCISETGTGAVCADGRGLDGPTSITVGADGENVYVASQLSDAVATLERNTTTGELSQAADSEGCTSETGSGGACVDGKALDGAVFVATSPDGGSLYIASFASDAVAVFRRSATGRLTQLAGTAGCVSETGSGGGCADGKALDGPRSVAVSEDGKSVYAASPASDAVVAFARNTTSGQLAQLSGRGGCVSEDGSSGGEGLPGDCADGEALDGAFSVAVSAAGESVYVASAVADAVAVFSRSTTTGLLSQLAGTSGCVSETGSAGTCADGRGLDDPVSVIVTSDGRNVYGVSTSSSATVVFLREPATGELTQLAAGCVSEDGTGGDCLDGRALTAARSVAVSPDGKHVYAASSISDAVTVFRRRSTNGELRQLAGRAGCTSESGSGGACADGRALDGASSVALSADGKHVYVAAPESDAVAVFARDAVTGRLTQVAGPDGCVSRAGRFGCTLGRALVRANAVDVSPDGKSVYVASGALAVFQRNATTGGLVQLPGTAGCVNEGGTEGCADGRAVGGASVAVSPDAKSVYLASSGVGALAVFQRNTTTGEITQLPGTAGCFEAAQPPTAGCAHGRAIQDAMSAAVSPDGKSVYVAAFRNDAVAVFERNTTTGALTQPVGRFGCVSRPALASDGCGRARALDGASSVAVSADAQNVYAASSNSGAVAAFARDTSNGRLTQLAGVYGCVSEDGSAGRCRDGKGLLGAVGVATSADGRSVYAASPGSHAVAVLARTP